MAGQIVPQNISNYANIPQNTSLSLDFKLVKSVIHHQPLLGKL